jgi:acyl-CoA synthetase (AMP-forming)/AMP-acid ligase II
VSADLTSGDVVGVLDWNSRRHFELYWAIPGIAAVMLQMNLRLAPAELGYVTDHSGASWVLVDETLLPVAEQLAPYAPKVRGWVVMSDKPPEAISTTLPDVHHFEELLAAADAGIDWRSSRKPPPTAPVTPPGPPAAPRPSTTPTGASTCIPWPRSPRSACAATTRSC